MKRVLMLVGAGACLIVSLAALGRILLDGADGSAEVSLQTAAIATAQVSLLGLGLALLAGFQRSHGLLTTRRLARVMHRAAILTAAFCVAGFALLSAQEAALPVAAESESSVGRVARAERPGARKEKPVARPQHPSHPGRKATAADLGIRLG